MTNVVKFRAMLPDGLGISQKEVLDILSKDGQLVSTNCAKYSQQNAGQYYCACNAWLALCHSTCGSRPARFLRNCIIDKGLLRVIDDANKAANSFIQSEFTDDGGTYLYPLFVEDSKETLQLLRFLKRFSPLGCDKVRDASIEAFLTINKVIDRGEAQVVDSDGRILRREYKKHRWLTTRVAWYCAKLLGPAPTWEQVVDEADFSNGVTADGCNTMLKKLVALSRVTSCYRDPLYPMSSLNEYPLDFVKVVAVPKSYKAWRIIAEVPAYQQWLMQGIRKLAVKATEGSDWALYIVQNNQKYNQEIARIGSIDGSYATIDLSAASDSIGDALAHKILPQEWISLIDRVNPSFILYGNRRIRRHIFQTSGNGTTFIFESIIFLAIALVATDICETYLGVKLNPPRTFGDDLEVDTRVYDTLVDLLTLLGFKVNIDKSFGDGFYRESCGSEWYCGLDQSTKYWPRKEIRLPNNRQDYLDNVVECNASLASMIALQHKLYSYEAADAFMVSFIRDIASTCYGIPVVTSSLPGTECEDLWEAYPLVERKRAPHGGILSDISVQDLPDYLTREKHLVLRTQYPDVQGYYPVLDMYKYVEFLHRGPRYNDATDRRLLVSAEPLGNASLANVAMTKFGYQWV